MKKIGPEVRKGYNLDEFAGRKAARFLANGGMSPFEKKQRQVQNLIEMKKFQEGLELIQKELSQLVTSDEDSAVLLFLTASCHHKLLHLTEAKQIFQEVVDQEKKIKNEKYLIPFSYCALAEISCEEGNSAEVNKNIQKASTYSKYDFESWLASRLKRVSERMEKKVNGNVNYAEAQASPQ